MALLVPKFGSGWLGQWLMARVKTPFYRVNLDEFGTWIWLHCDGKRSVKEIIDGLRKEFGDRVEPVHERVVLFFRQLAKGQFVIFRLPPASSEDPTEPSSSSETS